MPNQRLRIGQLTTALADGDRRFRLAVEGLELAPGAVLAVTGASGSGKTLFLELLGLLRAPEAGGDYALLDAAGREVTDLGALWARGARSSALAATRGGVFGFVPQSGALIPFLSVVQNVTLTQRVTGREDAGRVHLLLDRLGLATVKELRPDALSIGQRQRVSIARALAHRPAFVIADEPTAALDQDAAETVMALLIETATIEGVGVILSSHDVDRLDRLALPRLHFASQMVGPGEIFSTAEMQAC
jgi:putative ABC transport system ATP-binding protein